VLRVPWSLSLRVDHVTPAQVLAACIGPEAAASGRYKLTSPLPVEWALRARASPLDWALSPNLPLSELLIAPPTDSEPLLIVDRLAKGSARA
jgi:hypothetical protein